MFVKNKRENPSFWGLKFGMASVPNTLPHPIQRLSAGVRCLHRPFGVGYAVGVPQRAQPGIPKADSFTSTRDLISVVYKQQLYVSFVIVLHIYCPIHSYADFNISFLLLFSPFIDSHNILSHHSPPSFPSLSLAILFHRSSFYIRLCRIICCN